MTEISDKAERMSRRKCAARLSGFGATPLSRLQDYAVRGDAAVEPAVFKTLGIVEKKAVSPNR